MTSTAGAGLKPSLTNKEPPFKPYNFQNYLPTTFDTDRTRLRPPNNAFIPLVIPLYNSRHSPSPPTKLPSRSPNNQKYNPKATEQSIYTHPQAPPQPEYKSRGTSTTTYTDNTHTQPQCAKQHTPSTSTAPTSPPPSSPAAPPPFPASAATRSNRIRAGVLSARGAGSWIGRR